MRRLKGRGFVLLVGVAICTFFLIFQWVSRKDRFCKKALAQGNVEECRGYLVDHDILGANSCFENLVSLDPSDPEANFFYSVTRILALAYNPTFNNLLDRLGITAEGRDLYNLTAGFQHDSEGHIILPSNAPDSGEAIGFLKDIVLPEIDGALSNLHVINDSFDLVLTGDEIPTGVSVEVDYCDVALYRAVLHAAKAAILIADAYDLNISDIDVLLAKIYDGTFSFNADILDNYSDLLKLKPLTSISGDDGDFDGEDLTAFALAFGCSNSEACYDVAADFDGNGLINEDDLDVFSKKFGWLTQMDTAKHELSLALQGYMQASACIRGESDLQDDDFIIIAPEDLDNEQALRNILNDVQRSLSGPYLIGDEEFRHPIRIDLSQFFDDSIDLREYLPQLSDDNVIMPCTFPDPTVNGIFPDFNQDTWVNMLSLKIPVSGTIQCSACTPGHNIFVASFVCPSWAISYGLRYCSEVDFTSLSFPGPYSLNISANEQVWIAAFWDHDDDGLLSPGDYRGIYSANPVEVISTNCSGPDDINVSLTEQIIGIRGQVTSQGIPVTDASISVSSGKCWSGEWLGHTNSDANGFYIINDLPESPVYLEISWPAQGLWGAWWTGNGISTDCNQAVGVVPSAGNTIVDINF